MKTLNNFSIFLPVRNGGQCFYQCVQSILEQTCEDFNLVVLDNSSTDGSLEVIHAIEDSRLTVYESQEPLSIEKSWGRIVDMPKNEFMTIIGHDDLLDPNYLATMQRLIEKNPNAGLYQAHFRLIDSNGKKIRSCEPMLEIEKVDGFLAARLSFQRDSFGTGYMFRSADYERVGGIPHFKNLMFADDALWIELMKDSYKVTTDEECFSYRVHAKSTSYAPNWHSTYEALASYLSFLRSCSESNNAIATALCDKLYEYMIFWFRWAYFSVEKNYGERKAVENEIYRLCQFVESMLSADQKVVFIADVEKRVFSSLAYYRWLGWRGRKQIERRLSSVFAR